MRRDLGVLIACSVALAGCGGATGQQPAVEATSADSSVVLGGGGFAADGVTIAFSAERAEVEAALGAVLGEPQARDENDECGAGPMQFTSYPGGLTANFQQGRLVGWFFRDANPKIALENGITVGTP